MGDIPQAHTVTFTGGGPPAGDPTQPTKGKSYTGGFASSGIIGKAPGVGPELFTGGDRFSLTFPNPGTYTYICILHIDQGMAGVVEVGAPGSGGAAPSPAAPVLLAAHQSWSDRRRPVTPVSPTASRPRGPWRSPLPSQASRRLASCEPAPASNAR